VTFDDGYQSTLKLAAPVLVSLKIPFHVFITKSYVDSGDSRYLAKRDLIELAELPGATLGLHGMSHSRLSSLSDDSLHREMRESRDWLEQLIGRSVNSLSYPHGDFDARVSAATLAAGITTAACSNIGTFLKTSQSLSIPRIDIWSYDSPKSTVAKIRGDWDFLLP
jgi:peptidoglycan/xylan/chitin deacetylase (PgdA/CDA1 family)